MGFTRYKLLKKRRKSTFRVAIILLKPKEIQVPNHYIDESTGVIQNRSNRCEGLYCRSVRLVHDVQGKAADLENRSTLPFLDLSFFPLEVVCTNSSGSHS